MCGLFGYTCYGNVPKNISKLTQSLAEEAAVRRTDATGIAYDKSGKVKIFKQAKAASDIKFNHSDNVRVIIGHTRHSTQGSEKRNFNNHPFPGKCKDTNFAFAHNGVLMNDNILKMRYNFPKTHIETDSYVGVQLLEYKKNPNVEIAVICDVKEAGAKKRAEQYQIPKYCSDYKEILADENIDAVSIVTPTFTHKNIVCEALRAGKHVLCEKPPAMNYEEACECDKTAKETGKILMYAFVVRISNEADMFGNEINHFVNCCLGKEDLICTPANGVEIMKIITAIYESAKTGREIVFE